jgi:hypothetical protein
MQRSAIVTRRLTKTCKPTPWSPEFPFKRHPELAEQILREFLASRDCCNLESADTSWRIVLKKHWRDSLLGVWGVPAATEESAGDALKQCCGWNSHFRIQPGVRALGLELGSPLDAALVDRGDGYADVIVNTAFDAQLSLRASLNDLGVGGFDGGRLHGWQESEHDIGIWHSGGLIAAIGICHPCLGSLYIPGRPELNGVRVGTPVTELMEKLHAKFTDITIIGSNYGGTLFYFERHLPEVIFQLDIWDQGQAKIDPFVAYDDPDALQARLSFAIGMIVVEV